jgi:NAD(P)-dependent dehydrogenase (short-subunit alcohol dehydrogenase family)
MNGRRPADEARKRLAHDAPRQSDVGRAIATAFAAAGAAVCVTARSADLLDETVAAVETSGGRAFGAAADVSDPAAVARLVAEPERAVGPVDVLVSNAAVTGTLGLLWEVDPHEWWGVQEVNMRRPFLCARAVLPGMIARRRGRVLNVSTGTIGVPYTSAYSTAKAAVARLSEVLALETREYGVSVFALNSGGVRTAMTDAYFGSPTGRRWLPGWQERLEVANPTPERAVALCLTLASGAADALSGRFLDVQDDITALIARANDIRAQDLYTLRRRTDPPTPPAAS